MSPKLAKFLTAAVAGAIVAAAHAHGLPLDPTLADALGAFLLGLVLNFPLGKK